MALGIGKNRRGPQWQEIALGVRFLMRPATAIEIEAARHAAKERVRAALAGADAMADLGLEAPGMERLGDPHFVVGLTRWLIGCELAMQVVSDWAGLVDLDADSAPAPLERRFMGEALREERLLEVFELHAFAAVATVVDEGKKSPLPPNGSAAEAAPTAPGAPSAETPAPPGTEAAR